MPARFTYKNGDRPLDGYTIKRGIGHGGFGEVYFAVSDGGKEVALKLIRTNVDVELRGIQICLNLKHHNLVQIYDLKEDVNGNNWIVMEYISGKGLNEWIKENPRGLSEEQVCRWFPQMARGVAYLHEKGIVHRDLKPGNVFIENDVVKVGDYGLCKLISGTHQFQHTEGIGTLYYMAPEVGQGVYGKAIDIYAAGAILYEMLTGQVPFNGQTPSEILIKHQTAAPDLSRVPEPYRPIIAKALHKQPDQRYASMTEMAEAVEKIGGSGEVPTVVRPTDAISRKPPPVVIPVEPKTDWRLILAESCGTFGVAAALALLWMVPWIAVEHLVEENRDIAEYGAALFLITLTSWSVLALSMVWRSIRGASPLWMRLSYLITGLGLGVVAAWLRGWSFDFYPEARESAGIFSSLLADLGQACPLPGAVFCYMTFFGLALAIPRWWRMTDRQRRKRFSFWPVVVTGLGAALAALFWPETSYSGLQSWVVGFVVLIATSVIVQLASPWYPPPPKAARAPLRYRLT
ncbi:MAG: serine/threonine protein kinase [Gemmatales bacterium]|nr:serine/threonine protein kinase [Gemmatales bacterium]MDW8387414.1 serine/threonine-protein kinase [Gemmatales bacterium]